MFGSDRATMRAFFATAWRKRQAGEALEPLEALVAAVVAEHPEYHALLADADSLEREYTPQAGIANPFLHLSMHVALREQVATDRPTGIAAVYRALGATRGVAEAEHAMMECLGESLWRAQRDNALPDEAAYLDCLRRL